MFFKKLSIKGLNFCRFSSCEILSINLPKAFETEPISLKTVEFFRTFSIAVFDFVPFFKLSNNSFNTSFTDVELFLIICSKLLESASFRTSFKTLLSFGKSIFNNVLFETIIQKYNISKY